VVPSTSACFCLAGILSQTCWFSTAQVGIEQVKRLRAQTGAPIGDVKKALENSGNDIKVAHDLLRRMGIAEAAKKSSRPAKEVLTSL
jgi:elongation factor Ts